MWPCALLWVAESTTASAADESGIQLGGGRLLARRSGELVVEIPGAAEPILARDAAVVTLRKGAVAPEALRAEGTPIGSAARSWIVEGTAHEDGLAIAARWARDPAVGQAIPDLRLPKQRLAFDDPAYPDQWYLEDLGMDALYDVSLGSADIRVAVVDSGIDIRHPDLEAGIVAPFDTIDGDDDPSPVVGEFCPADDDDRVCDDHGTAVTGIVGARANNGLDLVGMCPACSLVPIRTIGEDPPVSAEIAAFEHALDAGADVINNSWGYSIPTEPPLGLRDAIERATTEGRDGLGTVVVFAAGNEDRVVKDFEITNLPGVICVSAVDHYDFPTQYSNRGRSVDVAAPSATVSLAPGGSTTSTFGGTSAAAPVVSGLVGWLLSQQPDLTDDEIAEILVDSARKTTLVTFDDEGHHPAYGYGIVDPQAALERMLAGPAGGGRPEEPRGCGCDAPGVPTPMAALLSALILVRRRRP